MPRQRDALLLGFRPPGSAPAASFPPLYMPVAAEAHRDSTPGSSTCGGPAARDDNDAIEAAASDLLHSRSRNATAGAALRRLKMEERRVLSLAQPLPGAASAQSEPTAPAVEVEALERSGSEAAPYDAASVLETRLSDDNAEMAGPASKHRREPMWTEKSARCPARLRSMEEAEALLPSKSVCSRRCVRCAALCSLILTVLLLVLGAAPLLILSARNIAPWPPPSHPPQLQPPQPPLPPPHPAAPPPSLPTRKQPNILFFLADDMGYGDAGYLATGNRFGKLLTPHMDALTAAGMSFTDAYAGAPTCSPSRCSLMTGLHSGRYS